tara:strand:+ start:60 stop:560 length:501 start_codon:yes stop_codon:yes gene_type:complete
MAHFAELELKQDPTGFTSDDKYIVKRVVVIGNDIPAANGILEQHDMHEDGEFHCKKLFGGIWKQTSYNHNFRKRYAGKSAVYDLVNDVFHGQQPHASWTLNTETWKWEAPITVPTMEQCEYDHSDGGKGTYRIEWSEANQEWLGFGEDNAQFEWNTGTSSWDATGG